MDDNIIVASKNLKKQMPKQKDILHWLGNVGLQENMSIYKFFKNCIKCLEHTLDGKGLYTTKDMIGAVLDSPTPTSADAVRQFLDLIGHYSSSINDFAAKANHVSTLKRGMLKSSCVRDIL